MNIATLIRSMAAAGATPEAIAIAVEAIESVQSVIDEKRAAARDKKRRQRAAANDDGGHGGDGPGTVSGQNGDKAGTVPADPLSLSPSFPQTPNQPHTHTPENTPRTRKAAAWPCPDGIDPQHWADVMAQRRKKNLGFTETAHAGQLRKIAELADAEWPPGRIVQHAAEHGWAAIHDPREKLGTANAPHQHQNYRAGSGRVDGFSAALREASTRRP